MHSEQHQADRGWVATSIFKRQPETVPCARNWATRVYSDAGGPLPDICELLVSEVATNAVLHGAGSEYRVSVRSDLAIEVWDESQVEPVRRHADDTSTTGRGMELLAKQSTYTVSAEPDGKTICFMPKEWGTDDDY